jgi:ATP-dependent Clp protease adaptor protein ClpS
MRPQATSWATRGFARGILGRWQVPRAMAQQGERQHGSQAEGAVAEAPEQKTKRPQRYKVLLHNDDYTTMAFVVMVLEVVFHRTDDEAVRIMLHVHHEGFGTAGVYSYEEAEARVAKVARLAREHEFPLRCSMEPE